MKSYTEREVKEALRNGKEVWYLNTGNDGEDDYLIGTRREVIADVLYHYEVEELPEHWELVRVDWEI